MTPEFSFHFAAKQTLGRRVAQLICFVLGAIGALPLLVGLVLHTKQARAWAEQQTSRLLLTELGLTASFQARVNLWPLGLTVENLLVPSNDGGAVALSVRHIRIAPRFFSLLAGKLDVGAVTIDSPKIRAKIEQGKLTNVNYQLPKSKGGSKLSLDEAPFADVSISDASFDVTLEGQSLRVDSLDLDVMAQERLSFEVFLRSSDMKLSRHAPRVFSGSTQGYDAYDEDHLCEFDVRARVSKEGLLVRRLALLGRTDVDPKPGSLPNCRQIENESDPALLAVRLSDVAVDWSRNSPALDGQVFVRAPVSLLNRYVRFLPVKGWLGVRGRVSYDGKTKLPKANVKLHGEGLELERYRLFQELDVAARIENDHIIVDELKELFGNGRTRVTDVDIAPLEPNIPFSAKRVEVKNVTFPGLMRDLGVTNKTIVAWDFGDTLVTDIAGHLGIPRFEGHIVAHTRDFEVFDRAFNDPARNHMIGVARGNVDGTIALEPTALEFRNTWVTFGASRMFAKLVSIGFADFLELNIPEMGMVRLADISPITTIPIDGKAKLSVTLKDRASNPTLYGTMSVEDLVFGGFPIGNILSSKVKFWPLKVEITEGIAQKGQSQFKIPKARLEFDSKATVLVDLQAKSQALQFRDFLAMWNFENDPRYRELSGIGAVDAKVHYALGGPEDVCGGGNLRIDGQMRLDKAELFGEHYDSGEGELSFNWLDQRAGFLGFSLDVPHLVLRKGPGAIIGAFQVRPGAELSGHAVATKVPLSRLESTAPWGAWLDTEISAVAEISGTLDAFTGKIRANASPVRVGGSLLKASDLTVTIEASPRKLNAIGTTRCGRPIPGPFDLAEYQADLSDGAYRVDGELLGGQVRLENVRLTRQRQKHLSGGIALNRLDLGSIIEALPAEMRPEQRTTGALSASIDLRNLPLASPKSAQASVALRELVLSQGELGLRAMPSGGAIRIHDGHVDVPGLTVESRYGKAVSSTWDLAGKVSGLDQTPEIVASVRLRPLNLAPLAQIVPGITRLSGLLDAEFSINGSMSQPNLAGYLSVDKGEAELKNLELPIRDVALRLGVSDNELRIERGQARIGAGTLELKGGAPLLGLSPGLLRVAMQARGLTLPERVGVAGMADADVEIVLDPKSTSIRPRLTGAVWFDGLEYSRPVVMTADVAQLAQRGRRSHVESYDPSDDFVDFDLQLFAKRPLRIRNGLVEAEMEIDKEGLQLAGTNQRFGLRGNVRAVPGGRISMRQSVFEIREGSIRFDETTRIAPRVDVKATTEYRRYSNQTSVQAPSASSAAAGSAGGSVAGATGGQWRITMHAHGDADQLRIDLTSDPALSRDDIFLLLTLGVTRAELDQAQSTSVGSSVALETLGTLSGADRAVTDTIPLIDDFRFGSAYSSRTGRTEPTVTIGKRLADRIRASVTSGLAESREIRSNVEWRLLPQLSVEGSYDNVNDISSSQLGNLGADVRWRVEFR